MNKQCTTFKCQIGEGENGSCKTNLKDCRAKGELKQEQQQSDKKAESKKQKKKKVIMDGQLFVTRRRQASLPVGKDRVRHRTRRGELGRG